MTDPSPEALDPAWLEIEIADPWELPEIVHFKVRELAGDAPEGSLQRALLEALSAVSSATLRPDDESEPFEAAIVTATKRTLVPADLTDEQRALLALALPLIRHQPLRARVADALWTYGDREQALLETAIDAYRAAPWEPGVWPAFGRDAWHRALQLAKRRGKGEAARLGQMQSTLIDRLLGGTAADGFMLVRISELLADFVPPGPEQCPRLADHLVRLASEVSVSDRDLARSFEEAASAWFARSRDSDNAHHAIARIAELYAAEADDQLREDAPRALAAAINLECALKKLLTIPRAFRSAHQLDDRIRDLRKRLTETRLDSLAHMQTIESDPVDISSAVHDARSRVSGKDRLAALDAVASVWGLIDPDDATAQARERLTGSMARLFSRQTLTGDGRKVAAGMGGVGEPTDAEVSAELIRRYDLWVDVAVRARVFPAYEVLVREHLFDFAFIHELCRESPHVPTDHEVLWTRGLHHGLRGDFASATAVLAPQVEQFVRLHLKAAGAHTLVTDEDGLETEKSLNALLKTPEAGELFGHALVLELRGLLVEQEGFNLRNDVAHGLFTDQQSMSVGSIYLWWMCLRLVVRPVAQRRLAAGRAPGPSQ